MSGGLIVWQHEISRLGQVSQNRECPYPVLVCTLKSFGANNKLLRTKPELKVPVGSTLAGMETDYDGTYLMRKRGL